MELIQTQSPAKTIYKGSQEVELSAKDKIRIQTKADGGEWVDLLSETVPNNKE